jgi:NodT family efflux transporter outer membrane factor (OMF) lipoprotein
MGELREVRQFSVTFAVALAVITSGCMVGPNFRSPAAPAVTGYMPGRSPKKTVAVDVVGGAAQTFEPGSAIPAQWWKLFRSPQLNRLITEAIEKNPNLKAAQAGLRVAAESVAAQQGYMYPAVTAGVGAERVRQLSYSKGVPSGEGSPYNLFNAGVSITYTLDVFGGIRRQIEALQAQEEYQRFQSEATYLALTANVVTAAIQEASLRGQIAATLALIHDEGQQLGIVRNEFKLGGASEADVLAQQTLVAQTEATLPPLRKQLAIERDLLRLLTGHFPSDDVGEHFDLTNIHLPETLPLSLPSELVEQRPDVRAYEALLHEASAQVGVATANMLPQFTIGGTAASFAAAAVNPASLAFDAAGEIAQPIFEGGTLLHRRRAAIAAYDQALDEYRYTVLVAFQNVADTLQALQFDADAVRADGIAETTAARSLRVAQEQYNAGYISYGGTVAAGYAGGTSAGGYLSLLSAEIYYQQSLLTLIQAEASRYADTAALFEALGGGWWNRQNILPANSSGIDQEEAAR